MWLTCSWWFTHITLSVKQESDVFMDENERERRWMELVSNEGVVVENEERKEVKRDWKKRSRLSVNREELVGDLKGFMILLVFWVLFGLVMEFV